MPIPWNKGLKIDRAKYPTMGHYGKHSEKTKKKMSISRTGKKFSETHIQSLKKVFSGKGNPAYIDGRMLKPGYRSWLKNKRNRVVKRLKNESLSHTFGEWETLKAQYGFTCPCCGKSEPEIKLTQDHIIPLSKGGSDLIENIQPLCKSCNAKKMTKIIHFNPK